MFLQHEARFSALGAPAVGLYSGFAATVLATGFLATTAETAAITVGIRLDRLGGNAPLEVYLLYRRRPFDATNSALLLTTIEPGRGTQTCRR